MNLQLRRAVYKAEGFDRDDIVTCPIVPEHKLKRKTLPYHIPDCKAKYGKGFLQCQFSQLHYFKTKEDLDNHERLCPMKRQFTSGLIAPAPAYNRVDDGDTISPLRRYLADSMVNQVKKVHLSGLSVNIDVAEFGSISDATRARIPMWNDLSKRVLLSRYRTERLPQVSESPSKNASGKRLQAVEEEADGINEEAIIMEESFVKLSEVHCGMRFPSSSDPGWDLLENSSENDEADGSSTARFLQDMSTYRFAIMGKPRLEDERDACAAPEDYIPDLNTIPKSFRSIMKRKLDRDLNIYKTGMNPRYNKSLDRPNAFRRNGPAPRQFEELAAWYEDLIIKPSQKQDANSTTDQSPGA
ncbi:uncharacterized protein LOC129581275 [Paramacrobiotus metropolitanus]|uniref:uncharacterized protein LOC129581275 n=1 Tax=Paramacrobiotus metropolitanus TaxID=2943436 RepID=UPI002445A3FB|nr:uncharacterized protein LOC129581275 [Paramacrobiotus metropolitanus]XP_055328232.1 uncharacterized protein LOC129581275 [Paramacrobiotus metropolitanus]